MYTEFSNQQPNELDSCKILIVFVIPSNFMVYAMLLNPFGDRKAISPKPTVRKKMTLNIKVLHSHNNIMFQTNKTERKILIHIFSCILNWVSAK